MEGSDFMEGSDMLDFENVENENVTEDVKKFGSTNYKSRAGSTSGSTSFLKTVAYCIPSIVYWVLGTILILVIAGLILRFCFPRYFVPLQTSYTMETAYRDGEGKWKTKKD